MGTEHNTVEQFQLDRDSEHLTHNKPFTTEELAKEIGKLKKKKAQSPSDEISNEMIIYGGEALRKVMLDLFNLLWTNEIFPKQWGKIHISPIYKKGDRRVLANYRPIAITSNIWKVFERLIEGRIREIVDIPDEQAGFRKGYGTIDNLFRLREIVLGRSTEGNRTTVAFIDLKEAYDRVWRDGLWYTLHNAGIRGKYYKNKVALYMYPKDIFPVT